MTVDTVRGSRPAWWRTAPVVAARAILVALRRFPIPALFVLAFSLVSNALVASPDALGWNAARLLAALAAAGFVALGVGLAAEARELRAAFAQFSALLVSSLVFSAVWFAEPLALYGPAVVAASLIAVPILPFLGRGSGTHVWVFALWLTVGLVLATVSVSIVLAGVGAILEMVRALFGLGLGTRAYAHLFTTATTLVGPLFALGRVPSIRLWDNRLEEDDRLVRALRPLLLFVGLPLVAAVALVYHVYLVQFAAGQEADHDLVAGIGLGFLASALLLRIQIVPFLGSGGVLLQGFARAWPWLLLTPAAALLWVAIEMPLVGGLTLWRYYLGVAALVFAVLAALQIPRRTRGDLRSLVIAPTLILLVSTFGPWGAPSVVGRSQERWLASEIAPAIDNGPDGVVEVPANVRYRALSRLETLLDLGQDWRAERVIGPLVRREPGEGEDAFLARARSALQLDRDDPSRVVEDRDDFTAPFPRVIDTAGFDRLAARVPIFVDGGSVEADGISLRLVGRDVELRVGDATRRVSLGSALAASGAAADETTADGRRVRVWIESATVQDERLLNVTITLALRSADWPALR